MKESVKIVEVGPRDGLQNENRQISIDVKVGLIERLVHSGMTHIEAASFVSPKWVPQMAGSTEVMQRIPRSANVHYSALVPNMQGLDAALAFGCEEIAVFGAASESFCQRNINCSIRESMERFRPVVKSAKEHKVRVRAYVSCVLGCPYEGDIAPDRVAEIVLMLSDMGCDEISLGDTIGRGTPSAVREMLGSCMRHYSVAHIAGHYHDTYGMAIANISTSLDMGVRIFDSSVSGLGGCPYATGASGNVATEDVVYLMHGMGFHTGIDLPKLVEAGAYISAALGRETSSRVARTFAPSRLSNTRDTS